MARKKKPADSVSPDLGKGPLWEGGHKPMGVYVRQDDGTPVQPHAVIWVDAESGIVQSNRTFVMEESPNGGVGEVVAGLEEALGSGGVPLRGKVQAPGTVRVSDAAQADAIRRSGLVPGAQVEVAAGLPMLEAVSETLIGYLGGDPSAPPPKPFDWKVDASLLPTLYRAAAELAERAPWTFMPDSPPIAIDLGDFGPRKNARTVYACVLGNAGELFGLAVYYSFAGYERTVETGLAAELNEEGFREAIDALAQEDPSAAELPPEMMQAIVQAAAMQAQGGPSMEDSMAVYFDPAEEHDPTYVDWLERNGLPVLSPEQVPMFFRARRSGKVGNLSAREVEAMALVLECVNAFVDTFRSDLEPDATSVLESMDGQLQMGTSYKDQMLRAWWPGDEYLMEGGQQWQPAEDSPEQS